MQSIFSLPPVGLRLYGCCKYPEWEQKLCSKWIKLWNDQWTKRSNYLTGGKQEPLSLWLVFYQTYLEQCVCVQVLEYLVLWQSRVCMLSHFRRVRLSATLWTMACQAPLSMGFSRQEYWSGLAFPSPVIKYGVSEVKLLSRVWLCDPMDCSLPGSSVHGIFQARVLEWGAISFSKDSHTLWQIVGRKNVADTLYQVYVCIFMSWKSDK